MYLIFNLIIKEFRELIDMYRFKTDKIFKYLKDNIDQLKSLKNSYLDKNKYHECRAKYLGTD